MKRKYSGLGLEEALRLIPTEELLSWRPETTPRPASDFLRESLRRLEAFDLQHSELAETLLVDALLAEVVPNYPPLKVWKAVALATDTLSGIADYLITPRRAYPATPLLCVAKAKRDDFAVGEAQCVAEMHACRWNNRQRSVDPVVYGIVTNGQGWQFYRLSQTGELFASGLYAITALPVLLGILDHICADCARSVGCARQA
jgi:hypothetical protein